MATITYEDLKKRNNISVFAERVNNKGSFNEKTEDGALLICTGKVKMSHETINGEVKLTDDLLRMFLETKTNRDVIEVECIKNKSKSYYRTSSFYKDKDFGGVAGKSSGGGSERQELGLIEAINTAVRESAEAWVPGIGRDNPLRGASKREGLSEVGQEPYIDVYVETKNGKLGVSCKGESAPSLAGGGIAGLKVVVPELLKGVYNTVSDYLKKKGYAEGVIVDADDVPDLFIEVPAKYLKLILVGNKKMGGPIDYMYVGKMDVKSSLDSKTKTLDLNGNFYSIDAYMKKVGKLYFRIRKRDLQPNNEIMITYREKNKEGYPVLFKGPKSNKNNFRLVTTDKVPRTGEMLKLKV